MRVDPRMLVLAESVKLLRKWARAAGFVSAGMIWRDELWRAPKDKAVTICAPKDGNGSDSVWIIIPASTCSEKEQNKAPSLRCLLASAAAS